MLTAEVVEGFVTTCLAINFDNPTPIPQFHRELWELCCLDNKLVAIASPRGHGKSTAITHAYLLASVLFREQQFVLLVSDTEAQAVEFLRDIKKELESNEHIRELFGIDCFTKDTEADVVVKMKDGYLFRIVAKGSEQKVRGLKWDNKRPDLIVIDDAENDEIVLNQDRRDKFKRWFRGALLPCRSPEGKVRIVGTVLHMGSLLNDLLPRDWVKSVVRTPLKTYDTNVKNLWKSVKYRAHSHDYNEILWPTRFSKAKLKDIRQEFVDSGYPDVYSQEYLNEPIDESVAFFKRSDFQEITEQERKAIRERTLPLLFYAGADLAISEKERADYSVIHVVGIDSNNTMYHIDTIRRRMDGKEIVDTILETQVKYGLQFFAIESEKIAKAIGPFLREEMSKRNIFVHMVEITPSADKQTRARSIQARMRVGSVKFDKSADYYPMLEAEFIRFPRDIHDDQVDALSVIGLALDKLMRANTPKEQIEEDWEDFDDTYEHESRNAGRSLVCGY